jgi:hypothetical protein
MKLKWRVQEVPTGRYRSFQRRGWPNATYPDGKLAASISCEDDYQPHNVKVGKHAPLKVRVCDYSVTPWCWRTLKGAFLTLGQAKAAAEDVLERFTEVQPKADDL